MSCKVNHNVVKLVDAQALTVSGGATPNATSDWYDIGGWVDKVVQVDVDVASGTPDAKVEMLISPLHYYELNNTTATTEDYTTITIVASKTTTTLSRYDENTVAELGTPIRSCAIKVTNSSATVAISGITVWVEGNS